MSKFKVPENKSIQELEDEVIEYWKVNSIFEKSVTSRPSDNLYVFYDGPPFISGLPHYGHLLGSIAKDVIPRYWTMKGKRVERVWGWDAHGLTVENKVQAQLGIKSRRDIEAFGLEKFIKECYAYTSQISGEWEWYITKIGRWVDMEHAYKTIDQGYMESVMWAFKELFNKGLIYEGVRTSLYCTTCGTPVSNFEIAMDNTYKEHEDSAITIAFEISSEGKYKGHHLLAWTTTPWTIPSNRGLVVDANEAYSIVSYAGKKYLVAEKRLSHVFEGLEEKMTVESTLLGSELIGLKYTPIYDFYKANKNDFSVYAYPGMVNMEDGSGIVHSAPGFGEVDTEMGEKNGLTLMLTIDNEGKFIPGDFDVNPFEGLYYAKANPVIIEDLLARGALFKNEKIVHRIPYHDRCNTLLIQRAQSSWFVNVQKIKKTLLDNNRDINWVPEHLKNGRFAQGIEQAPDWCISRSRFWATPMPIWKSEDGDLIIVGSVQELEELSGQKVVDLHRPYIDSITITKNNKVYTRIPDVLDSWFEAGSMPYAQIHYPFENRKKFDDNFPGDYIVEYIAQVRAWFYVMHILSTALFDKNSFKNVISTGVMAGSDGRKMSKTYGNYTDPKEVLEKIGGDALRLYLMGSPLMIGENANFDENELSTKLKNIINPLWNSLKYFVIYAEQSGWTPDKKVESFNVLDKWIIVKLHQFIKVFSTNIEMYQIPDAVNPITDFVDDLSRWYVRRSRDRISQGDVEAISTLYYVLDMFARAAAPAIPFIAEQIFMHLHNDSNSVSVHLTDYPVFDISIVKDSDNIIEDMTFARDIVSQGHFARTNANIPVRQPLSKLVINAEAKLKDEITDLIKDELNVKSVSFDKSFSTTDNLWIPMEGRVGRVYLNIEINKDLELEGNKRLFERTVQGLRKKHNLTVGSLADVYYPKKYSEVAERYQSELKSKLYASKLESRDSEEFSIEPV